MTSCRGGTAWPREPLIRECWSWDIQQYWLLHHKSHPSVLMRRRLHCSWGTHQVNDHHKGSEMDNAERELLHGDKKSRQEWASSLPVDDAVWIFHLLKWSISHAGNTIPYNGSLTTEGSSTSTGALMSRDHSHPEVITLYHWVVIYIVRVINML